MKKILLIAITSLLVLITMSWIVAYVYSEEPETISTVTEIDTPDSPNDVTVVVVNHSSFPVVAVNLEKGDSKENKFSGSLLVGDSITLPNINPTDSIEIYIIKSNTKRDHWSMGLKAGKTYTYTIKDLEDENAALIVINKTSLPIVTITRSSKSALAHRSRKG